MIRKWILVTVLLAVMIAPAMGYTWKNITLDSEGDVGLYPSLAVDSLGYPHISYYNSSSSNLKYTHLDSSNFFPLITVDSTGTVLNSPPSLAVNSLNQPAIAYFTCAVPGFPCAHTILSYAFWDGSAWIVGSGYAVGDIGSNAAFHPSVSLAFDLADVPTVAYFDQPNNSLQYAQWDGGDWIIRTVDNTGSLFDSISLKFNSTGYPGIAYHRDTGNDLKYADFDGTNWIPEIVDAGSVTRNQYSLGYNQTDNATITYHLTSAGNQLKYAQWDEITGTWHTSILSNYGGPYSSLAFNSSWNPAISNYNTSGSDLEYIYWDGTGWRNETVDSTGTTGLYNSLGINQYDTKFISYYNSTGADLKLAYSLMPPPYIGNAIYGIVYNNQTGLGVNGATVMARNVSVAPAYSLNVSFNYGGFNGIYFFERAVDSETVILNATKLGYSLSSDHSINTGAAGSAVQEDIPLTPVYTLALTFRDATSGALITPGSVDIVMNGTKVYAASTTTGTMTVTDIPFGWILVTTSSSGYYADTRPLLLTADMAETINLTSTSAAQQAMWNSPHQVRWQIVDRYGNRIPNVWLNITPISMTLPSGNWLLTMFGLGSTVSPVINTSVMNGTTGTDGAVVFTMLGSITYNIQITNAALGINHLETINPIEDQYTVWVPTTATTIARNCGMTANASLFVNASPSGAINLNVSYMDSSLSTNNFTFWLQWPNQTIIYQTDFFGPAPDNQTVYTNWTVANTAGQSYVWGYYANTSLCGNLTAAQGITLKGPTGRLINFDGCEVTAAGCGWS